MYVKYTDAREPEPLVEQAVISDILFRMGKQKEMRTGRVAAPVSFRGGHPSLLSLQGQGLDAPFVSGHGSIQNGGYGGSPEA